MVEKRKALVRLNGVIMRRALMCIDAQIRTDVFSDRHAFAYVERVLLARHRRLNWKRLSHVSFRSD